MKETISYIKSNYIFRILLSIIFLIFSSSLNIYVGRVVIPMIAPERYPMVDLSFNYLPYIKEFWYVSEVVTIVLLVLLLFLLYKNKFKNIDKYIFGIGLLYFMRALTTPLNPVDHSWAMYDDRLYALSLNPISDVNGFFFSGHMGWVTLLVIYISSINKKLLLPCLILLVLNIFSQSISRSHYLIDLYAGILVAILIGYWLEILPFKKKEDIY